MDDQVELRQFIRAKVITELRSVSRTAEKLHISQPALTTDMKKFQDALRVRLLLILSGNRMRLTRVAIAFSVLVQENEGTIEDCTGAGCSSERRRFHTAVRLRVFCRSGLVPGGLQRISGDDNAIMPLEADAAILLVKVASGELDAAIMTKPANERRLCIEEIRRDRLVVCLRADDPLALKPKIKSADLENKSLILYHPEQHPDAYVRLVEFLQDADIRPNISHEPQVRRRWRLS